MADGVVHLKTNNVSVRLERLQSYPFVDIPEDADDRRHQAESRLKETQPIASCTFGLMRWQTLAMKRTGLLLGLLGMISPGLLTVSASTFGFGLFAVLIAFRVMLIAAGFVAQARLRLAHRFQNARRHKTILPMYTVLVPVYREPKAVTRLVAALKGLDYPKRLLDIQILIEESDEETLEALLRLRLKPHFRIVPVPRGKVQTKPRALNYGLSLARGQFVAIYDAEDQMHAGQLKAAVRAFQAKGSTRLACVQAPLIPHNGGECWIARQFELEYLIHFGLIVPGLTSLDLPVMLGGTSNHFRRDILERVGGWDPYNVTEDADLGLRLAAAGYKVGMIDLPTYEEAPVARRQWIGQRSRWIKGFIQTLGVFLRRPGRAIRRMGLWNWACAICLLGGSVLSAIVHGPLALWLVVSAVWPGTQVPGTSVMLLLTGFGVHLVSAVLSWPDFRLGRVVGALTAPLYWPLQTFSAIKALRELRSNPYFWDKTEHGVTSKELCRSKLNG